VESRDLKEVQNEYILRLVCFQSVVRASCSRPRRQRDRAAVAPARGPAVRYISARAALHAWPRPKMAREARAERKLIESSGISSEVETVAEPWTGPRPMISTQPSSAFLANRDGQADFSTLVGSDQLQPGCRRAGNGPWHIGVYIDFGKHNWGHRGRCHGQRDRPGCGHERHRCDSARRRRCPDCPRCRVAEPDSDQKMVGSTVRWSIHRIKIAQRGPSHGAGCGRPINVTDGSISSCTVRRSSRDAAQRRASTSPEHEASGGRNRSPVPPEPARQ
jgi:hypothetical protein